MKRHLLILSSILLCSCAGTGNPGSTPKEHIVYLDKSAVETEKLAISLGTVRSYKENASSNCSFSLTLNIKNLTNQTISFPLDEKSLVRESNDATYSVTAMPFGQISIDSEITKTITFSATIPSLVEEDQYRFSAVLEDCKYTVKLYETPDEKREDIRVEYRIGGKAVHTTTMKERRALGESYIYENPNQLSHCSVWKTAEGETVTANTIINEDVFLEGSPEENLQYFELSDSTSSSVLGVKYIPKNGIVVIPSMHGTLEVKSISNYGIYNLPTLETLYLPRGITRIYFGNFDKCPLLSEIHFGGTENEWKAINNSSTIPSNVTINYNSIFA